MEMSTEDHRLHCEAVAWIRMFNDIKATKGLEAASGWWGRTISNIEKRRGKDSAEQLRRKMNELRSIHR